VVAGGCKLLAHLVVQLKVCGVCASAMTCAVLDRARCSTANAAQQTAHAPAGCRCATTAA
jgi:hypothetical protein